MTKDQAFFIAAAAAPGAATLMLLTPTIGAGRVGLAIAAFPVVFMSSLIAEVVVGGPLYLFGLRFRLIRWWSSGVAGLCTGLIADCVIHHGYMPDLSELLALCAIGTISGLVFWVVAVFGQRTRPVGP